MPDGLTKEEIVDVLLREEYGFLPDLPIKLSANIVSEDANFCAGKAVLSKIELECSFLDKKFSFPVYSTIPKSIMPVPAFVYINFRDSVPDKYLPSEEIVDAGYAVFSFCYADVTSDDADFSNGLAGCIYPNGKTDPYACGKIGLWAWAAMRVMDYVQTLDSINRYEVSVAGHSRLGKTALLAGALDERFYCAFSNDSGCSGAALSRNKVGESIAAIVNLFPYWFCDNYQKYANNEEKMPFDQHWLLAANAPHRVYVASAAEDTWADPKSEFLSCVAAGDYYTQQGLRGCVHLGRMCEPGDFYADGNIGYHLRTGTHYHSRQDWRFFIQYLNKQKGMLQNG